MKIIIFLIILIILITILCKNLIEEENIENFNNIKPYFVYEVHRSDGEVILKARTYTDLTDSLKLHQTKGRHHLPDECTWNAVYNTINNKKNGEVFKFPGRWVNGISWTMKFNQNGFETYPSSRAKFLVVHKGHGYGNDGGFVSHLRSGFSGWAMNSDKRATDGKLDHFTAPDQVWEEAFIQSPNKIIHRQCKSCAPEHQSIYYRRLTPISNKMKYWGKLNLAKLFIQDWWEVDNRHNIDFELYSSYQDAINRRNRWNKCNFNDPNIGFPRDCGKSRHVGGQWGSLTRGGHQKIQYSIEVPADFNSNLITQYPYYLAEPKTTDIKWQKGFCVMKNGRDQNSGVNKINFDDNFKKLMDLSPNNNNFMTSGSYGNQYSKYMTGCYLKAVQELGSKLTGVEVIHSQGNRGCYAHTHEVSRGNGVDRHYCVILDKDEKEKPFFNFSKFAELSNKKSSDILIRLESTGNRVNKNFEGTVVKEVVIKKIHGNQKDTTLNKTWGWDGSDGSGLRGGNVWVDHGLKLDLLVTFEGEYISRLSKLPDNWGNTPTPIFTYTGQEGKHDTSFNGSQQLRFPSKDLKFRDSFTVSIWFKWTARVGDWVRLIGKGNAHNRNYGLWLHPNGHCLTQIYGIRDPNLWASPKTKINQWYQIALTYDKNSGVHTMYFNGKQIHKRGGGSRAIDPRHLFVDTWSSSQNGVGNRLNQDFELYSSEANALRRHDRWRFCNYDDRGIGFPRDCGHHRGRGGQWRSWSPRVRDRRRCWRYLIRKRGGGWETAFQSPGCGYLDKPGSWWLDKMKNSDQGYGIIWRQAQDAHGEYKNIFYRRIKPWGGGGVSARTDDEPLTIGGADFHGKLKGLTKNAAVWNVALSADKIQSWYNFTSGHILENTGAKLKEGDGNYNDDQITARLASSLVFSTRFDNKFHWQWQPHLSANIERRHAHHHSMLTLNDSSAFRFRENFTIFLTFKTERYPRSWARLIGKGDRRNRNYGIWMHPNGHCLTQIYGPRGANVWASPKAALNKWYHIALVFEKNKYHKMYWNGVLHKQVATRGDPRIDSRHLTIGGVEHHGGNFHGWISNIAMFNTALTGNEIQLFFKKGSGHGDQSAGVAPSDEGPLEIIQRRISGGSAAEIALEKARKAEEERKRKEAEEAERKRLEEERKRREEEERKRLEEERRKREEEERRRREEERRRREEEARKKEAEENKIYLSEGIKRINNLMTSTENRILDSDNNLISNDFTTLSSLIAKLTPKDSGELDINTFMNKLNSVYSTMSEKDKNELNAYIKSNLDKGYSNASYIGTDADYELPEGYLNYSKF